MDELAQLEAKFAKANTSVLKDLLQSGAENIDEIRRKQDLQLNEDKSKLEQLTSKLSAAKETLHKKSEILENKKSELLKHQVYLEELETQNRKLKQEIKQLEGKRNHLKSTKPSLQDQQLLDQGKKKYKLYKELTRIYWDYGALENNRVEGYVTNKHDYVHHFNYESHEINDELHDSLWHEIYLSTSEAEVKDKAN